MAKYDPLHNYLRRKQAVRVEMTFPEIERVIGAMLPKRAEAAQWWIGSEQDPREAQRHAWTAAGYDARLIAGSDRVIFSRRS